jgi:hypothetical protein
MENYHIITFPGLSLSKNRDKLLPPAGLQKVGERGCFYGKYHTEQFTDTVN